jgi:hypothetical protein
MIADYSKFLNVPQPSNELILEWLSNYYGNAVNGDVSPMEQSLAQQAAAWGYMQCEGEYERAAMQLVPPTWLELEDEGED